jgi:hypothetical protein
LARHVDEVTKFCRKMKWMRCFDCGHVIEKKAGCNHITCFCGSQFCYLCGSTWGTCKCQNFAQAHALRHNRVPALCQGNHRCPHCRQVYDTADELRVHVGMCQAGQDGAFECTLCRARFSEYQQYRDHRKKCFKAQAISREVEHMDDALQGR